jgi:hypothetical protein
VKRKVLKLDKEGKPIIPEGQVQSAIIDYLLALGYEVIRFNSGGGKVGNGGRESRWLWFYSWFGKIGLGQHKGVVDLYAWGNGVSFWIEVKRKNGEKREQQKKFIKSHKENGCNATFAESLEEVIAYEREIQRLHRKAVVEDALQPGRDTLTRLGRDS